MSWLQLILSVLLFKHILALAVDLNQLQPNEINNFYSVYEKHQMIHILNQEKVKGNSQSK